MNLQLTNSPDLNSLLYLAWAILAIYLGSVLIGIGTNIWFSRRVNKYLKEHDIAPAKEPFKLKLIGFWAIVKDVLIPVSNIISATFKATLKDEELYALIEENVEEEICSLVVCDDQGNELGRVGMDEFEVIFQKVAEELGLDLESMSPEDELPEEFFNLVDDYIAQIIGDVPIVNSESVINQDGWSLDKYLNTNKPEEKTDETSESDL